MLEPGDERRTRRIVCGGGVDLLQSKAREGGGAAVFAHPGDAEVGRKFAGDFVAQAQAEIGLVDAGGGVELPVSLKGKLSLEPRLKDKFLNEAKTGKK